MMPSEFKELSVDELRRKEADLRKELFNLRFQISKGELINNSRVGAVKKNIARVMTLITAKSN